MRYSKNHHQPIKTKSKLKRQAWKVLFREVLNGVPQVRARWFSNLEDAEVFCKAKREEVRLAGDGSAYLTKEMKLEAIACSRLLEPTGKSLTEAVQYFLRETDLIKKSGLSVQEVAELYLKKLESKGRGFAYRLGVESFLKSFCEKFGDTKIALLKEHTIERWLNSERESRKQSAVTFNNHRNAVVVFLNYAVAKKYITENPACGIEKIEPRKRGQERPNRLLTPEEMQTILTNAPENLKTPIVLMGFCGLRLAEVSRLKWSHIMVKEKTLLITEQVSKTKASRSIPLSDLVCKYLETIEEQELRKYVFEPKNLETIKSDDPEVEDFYRQRKLKHELRTYKLRLRGAVNWKGNSLRVSAISYKVEQIGSTFETAEQMGNSPEIINRTYKNITNKRQATKWFSIDPLNPGGQYLTQVGAGSDKGVSFSSSPFPEDWLPRWNRSTGAITNLPKGITYDPDNRTFGGKAKGWWYFPEDGSILPPNYYSFGS